MPIKKYKRHIKKANEINVYDLRCINIYFKTKKLKIKNREYIEQIQKYFNENKRFEVNYYWKSCNWVYEFEFDEFLIYSEEFEKYFEIDVTKTRKEKLERLNNIEKSVQN